MAKATLGPVRISYPHLFEPYAITPDSEPKYSATFLIPKDDKKQVAELNRAIKEAEKEGVTKVFGGKMPPKVSNPIHDGDGKKENGEDFGEECKGNYVFSASSKAQYAPGVIAGRDRHKATPDELKAGDYGYITINFVPYNYNGKKGIGAYLQNIWKTKNGEPLGSGVKPAHEDFKELAKDIDSIDFGEDEVDGFELMDDELPF